MDVQLEGAILKACKANNNIIACYLLDGRKPESEEIILIIAVTVEDETNKMDFVAQQLWEMLQQFPHQASKTFIMSSSPFKGSHNGSEFYIRP